MTEKEEKFNEIVAGYPQSDFFSGKLCPDQYVGKITDFKNEDGEVKEDFPVRVNIFAGQTADVCIKFSSYEKIMILILESPHQEEFDEKGNPIGPANGTTGRHIRKYICDIFGNEYQGYHLVLINAIPFQCSLGFSLSKKEKENKKRRDEVFSAIWDNDDIGKEFFEGRLRVLLDKLPKNSKNVVIVNACTKDNDDKKQSGRKTNVTNVIKELIKTKTAVKEVWKTPHPSSGCWCAHKYCEKIYPEN